MIAATRWAVQEGDVDGAIATLVADYERNGDATVRNLAVEEKVAVVRPMIDVGRRGHEAWVQHAFPAAVHGLTGVSRARRVGQLVAVTDVYTWKILRRDKGLSARQVQLAMRELVLALHRSTEEGAVMSKVLMTTWAGAGNTPPMASVARALVSRGHEVHVLADELIRGDFEVTGARFSPWRRTEHRTAHGRDGDLSKDWEPDDPGEQIARLRDHVTAGPAPAHAADTTDAIERVRPDLLLCEQLLLGPLIAAEAADVPAVLLNPTVDVVPAPGRPPFGFGLMPATTPEDHERDRQLTAIATEMWDSALPAVNRARAEHGLTALEHTMDQVRSATRVLVMSSAAFDFPAETPPGVRYVGPRLEDAAWAQEKAWATTGEGPFVLVALSSDYQRQEDVLQRIATGLGELPVRALMTTGLGVDPSLIDAPANVTVVAAAPHGEALRQAAVCVTHCGHGTTLKALAAGVPLVCVPMGRDQFDVAARVRYAGAGVQVDAAAEPAAIAAAVREVLREPAFAARAAELAAAIASETESDQVVAEVEALVGAPVAA